MTADARITVEQFVALCREQAPFNEIYGFVTEAIGFGTARVRLPADPRHLRPGGTISGPSQMALADFTMYAAVMGAIGEVPLAVTTNLTINFLNRPQPGALVCDCHLLKLGKRLVVGEARLFSEGHAHPVSQATMTYSVPPAR